MSNLSLTDKASSFRFTRPTLGLNGTSGNLHEYAKKALEELEKALENGLPAPDEDVAKRAAEAKEEAAQLQETADKRREIVKRLEREANEASDAHRREEDDAERKVQVLAEARAKRKPEGDQGAGQAGKKGENPHPDLITKLERELEQARKNAQESKKRADTAAKMRDDEQATCDAAERDAGTASAKAARLRKDADEVGERALTEALGLPISSHEDKERTLLKFLTDAAANPKRITLREFIDRKKRTVELYGVKRLIDQNRNNLEFNERAMLSRGQLVDYLFARAVFHDGFDSAESVFNMLATAGSGCKPLYDHAVGRSLLLLREDRRIELDKQSIRSMLGRLKDKSVSLQADSFDEALRSLLDELVFGIREKKLLAAAETDLGTIPPQYVGPLIQFIQRSNADGTEITDANAAYFISIALTQLRKREATLTPGVEGGDIGIEDYSVSYYDEEKTTALEYDRASVEAAAQMYLTMVWGDELGIFEVVNRIATQTTPQLRLEIRSRSLSDDLRTYVLDEQYRDIKTNRICRRVSPAERQMFYRQVFGVGEAPVVDEAQVNTDFQRLWAVLMTEVVKYIGKIEENADAYGSISAQKVYQAIEDLQYNLSSYCSGLQKVAAPTMHGELDFVIKRILDSEDVKSQLARRGGRSFWKVIEEVRGFQDFTPLRNKGMFGHRVLSTIAKATPALLENQSAFQEFISIVEAYILAEDQLADAGQVLASPGRHSGFYGFDPANGGVAGVPAGVPSTSGESGGEWNF